MIARFEANYHANRNHPTDEDVRFWLREMRTPELLIEVARAWPVVADKFEQARPQLARVQSGNPVILEDALLMEQHTERNPNIGNRSRRSSNKGRKRVEVQRMRFLSPIQKKL